MSSADNNNVDDDDYEIDVTSDAYQRLFAVAKAWLSDTGVGDKLAHCNSDDGFEYGRQFGNYVHEKHRELFDQLPQDTYVYSMVLSDWLMRDDKWKKKESPVLRHNGLFIIRK